MINPMETAPKDGTQILLHYEEGWIQGYWPGFDKRYPTNHADLLRLSWVTLRLPSHGCGCCGGDDEEPTGWAQLPDDN